MSGYREGKSQAAREVLHSRARGRRKYWMLQLSDVFASKDNARGTELPNLLWTWKCPQQLAVSVQPRVPPICGQLGHLDGCIV
mmetsp:Transcript_38543/g.68485  ORF Transcript_38543/g.68485 Transcript_38543/m.68485 type:complete len:83 (-) Transcript_38543:87-335(-)